MSGSIKNNILYGDDFSYNETRGFGEVIFDCMQKYKDNIFQINSSNGEEQTYGFVHDRSVRVAMNMRSMGINSGDMISICSYNSMNTVLPYVASAYLNVKMCFFDPTLPLHTATHLMRIGKPKMIFCGPEAVDLMENCLSEIKKTDGLDVEPVLIVFGETVKYISFAEFLKTAEKEKNFQPVKVENNRENCLVFFSSGTTGYPKGICLSHYSILAMAYVINYFGYEISRVAHFTSFYWITASLIGTNAILNGYSKVIIPKFDPKTALQILQDYKVNYVFMANVYIHMIKNESYEKYDFTHLKYLVVSGVTMTKELMTLTKSIFPFSNVFCNWGMTEVGYATYFNPKIHKKFMDTKINSVGVLNPGMKGRVVDMETNETLGAGKIGEWRLKGDHFMSGYYNMDSTSAWDEDGWLRTGDLGFYDADGCIFIVDRAKDLMKYQSWHVVPAVLEGILVTHPNVLEAVVYGVPHEIDGDHPAALVVVKVPDAVTAEDIEKFVAERVHDREKLRGGVKIVKTIPKTPTGKVLRRVIREMVKNKEI